MANAGIKTRVRISSPQADLLEERAVGPSLTEMAGTEAAGSRGHRRQGDGAVLLSRSARFFEKVYLALVVSLLR